MEAVTRTRFTIPDWAGRRPVGRIVRGHNMGAVKDGWIVIHDNQERPMRPEALGELCVIALADGRCLVRTVRQGRQRDRYDLVSETGPAILDAEVVWVEPVTAIVPYKPTLEEMALLDEKGWLEPASL